MSASVRRLNSHCSDEGVIGDLCSESICSHPGASNSHPTPGHNLISSVLDFWLNFTPFWCKNHFYSLKTEGVIKYFLTKNMFPMTPYLVKVLLHCAMQWYFLGDTCLLLLKVFRVVKAIKALAAAMTCQYEHGETWRHRPRRGGETVQSDILFWTDLSWLQTDYLQF